MEHLFNLAAIALMVAMTASAALYTAFGSGGEPACQKSRKSISPK
jgi:hypothetical protein